LGSARRSRTTAPSERIDGNFKLEGTVILLEDVTTKGGSVMPSFFAVLKLLVREVFFDALEGKDGMRLDQRVELKADRRGDAGEIEQAIAGDVAQRMHAGDGAQNLQRLAHVDVGRGAAALRRA
jgi:hypothetical protein